MKEKFHSKDYLDAYDIEYLGGNKYVFLHSEIDTISFEEGPQKYRNDVYFRIDSDYFRLAIFFKENTNNKVLPTAYYIEDITDDCENWYRTNRINAARGFKKVVYTMNFYRNTIDDAYVVMENPLDVDIEFMKLRVNLIYNGEVFYRETVIHSEKIYTQDVVTIDVPGISGFFTDFKLRKDTQIQLHVEVLEIAPIEESIYCNKLNELKALEK